MNQPATLRGLLARKSILVVPGAYDALSAKILEAAGFEAIYLTGYGASASLLGQPDVGLLTMTEMLKHAANMVSAVSIPVICDIDNGYGNAMNVIRTVKEFERAGVAAVQLEDQVFPKRCGHMQGKQVISREEMVNRIKAAVDARTNKDLVIIARTDSRAVEGLDKALERAEAYVAAGADVIFVEALCSLAELKKTGETINAPLLANMIEQGRTPLLPATELAKMGYKIVLYPLSTLYAAAKAVKKVADYLMQHGTTLGFSEIVGFPDFNALVGLPQYCLTEARYKCF